MAIHMNNVISILDGRNADDARQLQCYFSEEALIFFRILVELAWLKYLSFSKDIPLRKFTKKEEDYLQSIVDNFSDDDSNRVKEIEKTTNHDVKAVEIFLREKLEKSTLKDTTEWIHFACTSEDINNLAWAMMIKGATANVIIIELDNIQNKLFKYAKDNKNVPMLSRTHGQPASPTTVGKEFLVFAKRLERQINQLSNQEYLGKFAGATGNFSAHNSAFPKANWLKISQEFVENLGLIWNPVVTQIEPHDFIAELSHNFVRINTILIDFARDIWGMISMEFFGQKVKKGEVGSSVMPHKVNPIDFENAEGNLGLSNALFTHFAEKLPISRFQRDLSDSTVMRNIGVAFGHSLIAYKKIQKGIDKLVINETAILKDLENHPEILAEAVQTVMRAEGIEDAYNKLKEFTRGNSINLPKIREFIKTLKISKDKKDWLLKLTPDKYIGIAKEIVEKFGK